MASQNFRNFLTKDNLHLADTGSTASSLETLNPVSSKSEPLPFHNMLS